MSEEENIERATAVAEELSEDVQVVPQTQEGLTLEDLKVGYVVGLTPDGDFVFDVFGAEKNLLSILGLHAHANRRVDQIYNQNQMLGDSLTHEVGKAVQLLNQKIDQVLQVVAPKKPDNEI